MVPEMFSALRMMSSPPAPEGGVGSSDLEFFVIAVFLPQRRYDAKLLFFVTHERQRTDEVKARRQGVFLNQ